MPLLFLRLSPAAGSHPGSATRLPMGLRGCPVPQLEQKGTAQRPMTRACARPWAPHTWCTHAHAGLAVRGPRAAVATHTTQPQTPASGSAQKTVQTEGTRCNDVEYVLVGEGASRVA